jgi:hypothetical protein
MQLKLVDIIDKVSEKYSLDKEVLQSISNSIFQETANKIKHPESLIIYLKGLGKIYARKKKTEEGIKKIDYLLTNPRPNLSIENLERNKESMIFLLSKYEEFIKDKNQHKNDSNNNTNN